MDSRKILESLVKIAENQQKMIQKLAQAQDPNIAWLKQVAEAAAMNLNAGIPISVQVSLGTPQPSPDAGVQVSQNYVIRIGGLKDEKQKIQFKTNLDSAVAIQKPELSAGISVIYS